jgi:hypothetical protein
MSKKTKHDVAFKSLSASSGIRLLNDFVSLSSSQNTQQQQTHISRL